MTHSEAMAAIRRLASGLQPDIAGCARLMERLSVHAESECLRDALIVVGRRALLESLEVKGDGPCGGS
jgi:hypothetical protein